LFVCVSVYAPAHTMPEVQVHVPAVHELPGAHAVPHAPQLALFVCGSTQAPAHGICPGAQGPTPPDPDAADEPPAPDTADEPPPPPFALSGLLPQASGTIDVKRRRSASFRPCASRRGDQIPALSLT
jgi:hypothetical protein